MEDSDGSSIRTIRQNRQEKQTLKEIASTEFTGENEGKEPEKVPAGVKHGQKINFKKLIKINSDIYAWIYVPGTRIDYPVAQSQESDDHYLKYNFKMSQSLQDVFIQRESE